MTSIWLLLSIFPPLTCFLISTPIQTFLFYYSSSIHCVVLSLSPHQKPHFHGPLLNRYLESNKHTYLKCQKLTFTNERRHVIFVFLGCGLFHSEWLFPYSFIIHNDEALNIIGPICLWGKREMEKYSSNAKKMVISQYYLFNKKNLLVMKIKPRQTQMKKK